jgi:hypothetical protein
MATTTNYSWSTPDDTALVKDGAAAIRTLGSSVDTTVKALNPGTTAGDIDYYTSSTAKARIAIGTANQQLRVNAGATAPEWFTPSASGGMTLISTTTLTGSDTTISSIPTTYKNLQLIVQGFRPNTDAKNMRIRFNGDSNTRYSRNITFGAGANITFGTDHLNASNDADNTATNSITVVDFIDYANTTTWKIGTILAITNNESTTTNYNFENSFFVYNQTPAITSITLIANGTTFNAGTALLYGVS